MGANGIGVAGFLDLSAADEFISVIELSILGNDIRRCLRRAIAPPPEALAGFIGYGGIALADVENLIVHDNTIIDNGADYLDPVCGVFVLHGEGIDIGRNRIRPQRRTHPAAGFRRASGPARRGRHRLRARRRRVTHRQGREISTRPDAKRRPGGAPPRQHRLHAAWTRARHQRRRADVDRAANQFTSQAVVPTSVDLSSYLAATVQILNLGLSNELYFQMLLFAMLNSSSVQTYLDGANDSAVAAGRAGLDDATLARLLANGQVLFSDNQVNLDLLARGLSLALTSTLIITLDDLGFHDNQCEANLYLLDDLLISHALLFGFTLRATGNRFKEGSLSAFLSALTVGLFANTTALNQGTHCIFAMGGNLVDQGNTAIVGPNPLLVFLVGSDLELTCDNLKSVFSKMLGGQSASQAIAQPLPT